MSNAGSSYGWACRSAATISGWRSSGKTVSSRSSGTRSSRPRSPTTGDDASPPRNVPVPAVYQEQRSYSPIRPAPAANTASRTASSASSGTKTTSFLRALIGVGASHGHDPGSAEADPGGAAGHAGPGRDRRGAERSRGDNRGLVRTAPELGLHAPGGARLRAREQRRVPDRLRVGRPDVLARVPSRPARRGRRHRLRARAALRGAGRDRDARPAHSERPRRRALPHPDVHLAGREPDEGDLGRVAAFELRVERRERPRAGDRAVGKPVPAEPARALGRRERPELDV